MSPLPTNSTQHNHSGILKDDFNEIVNWDDLDDSALEDQEFISITTTNALGRIITSTGPDGSVHQISQLPATLTPYSLEFMPSLLPDAMLGKPQ